MVDTIGMYWPTGTGDENNPYYADVEIRTQKESTSDDIPFGNDCYILFQTQELDYLWEQRD